MSETIASYTLISRIAAELKIKDSQVAATTKLLSEGATVPFISRYRKEVTGSLDEVQITQVRDRLQQLTELERRRAAIVKSLDERNLLTEELKKKIVSAETLTRLEDIFAPFRPKRRTRATIAKEKGLEPLATFLLENQENTNADAGTEAVKFIVKSEDKDIAVPSAEDALAGARDILAEQYSEDAECKAELRKLIAEQGSISSRVLMTKKDDAAAQKFKDYFEWEEPLSDVPSHRLLAMRRGEKEGFLFMRIAAPVESAIEIMQSYFGGGSGSCAEQVELALADSYKRLISLSLETEFRMQTKKEADVEAVRVFAENLRELLLASPLGQKTTLAIDPAFRTGCKTVVLDKQGRLLFDTVLHFTTSAIEAKKAIAATQKLVEHFKVEAIAIGNGTASRETEAVVRKAGLTKNLPIVIVNESGASIYSASEVAREEFPDKDVTVRGAVSIGRRLMDPLAELVKLDPKSIGVGQYQHDVDQNLLKNTLDDTVISCVNGVGVEVNTASKQLLSYVSGLNTTIAANIISYRDENGPIKSREDLKNIPRFGEKTFEQAAGFLRILGGDHPLDSSAVHPERYHLVEQIAEDNDTDIKALLESDSLRKTINLEQYVSEEVGLPTLQDILEELAKPGRDPRAQFELFHFHDDVEKPADLEVGMKLPGIVTNVTNFGAFVDVGVHQDGLVHISQLSDSFVDDPAKIVKVGQKVNVTVTEVDLERNRIGLSMKSAVNHTSEKASGNHRANRKDKQKHQRGKGHENNFGGNWFDNALKKGR